MKYSLFWFLLGLAVLLPLEVESNRAMAQADESNSKPKKVSDRANN